MRRLALLLLVVLPATGFAYELKRDSSGEVVRWKGKVSFVLDERAAELLGDPRAVDAVKKAVETVAAASNGLPMTVETGKVVGAGYNRTGANQNEIVIPEQWPYDSNTIAVTLVTVDASTHRILDADIAFNKVYRKFAVLGDSGESTGEHDDVQNTLTHELGHAVGLAHNAAEPRAVMYPGARKGEVNKRVLQQDDRDGLLELYPSGLLAMNAEEDAAPVGCTAGAGRSSAWLALFLLPLMLRRRSAKAVRAAAVACIALPASVLASEPTREPAAIAQAGVVATVEVTATHTREMGDGRMLFTEVEVAVRRCVKGSCPSRMMLLVPGGKVGNIEQYVEGAPVPKSGAVLGVTLQPAANVTAPSIKDLSVYRLDEVRDFTAFASGLSRAGLSVDLPLPQMRATQK